MTEDVDDEVTGDVLNELPKLDDGKGMVMLIWLYTGTSDLVPLRLSIWLTNMGSFSVKELIV